jgi:hypothetical protein
MHLAQLNIAVAKDTRESKTMVDFVKNVDRINALADNSPGFVWRLTDDSGADAYTIQAFDSPFILINMSVWTDRESLFNYVYKSGHLEIFRRKKEWFRKIKKMHMVLWYIEEGHIPTIEEGKERLKYLQEHGESEQAFSFKSKF